LVLQDALDACLESASMRRISEGFVVEFVERRD